MLYFSSSETRTQTRVTLITATMQRRRGQLPRCSLSVSVDIQRCSSCYSRGVSLSALANQHMQTHTSSHRSGVSATSTERCSSLLPPSLPVRVSLRAQCRAVLLLPSLPFPPSTDIFSETHVQLLSHVVAAAPPLRPRAVTLLKRQNLHGAAPQDATQGATEKRNNKRAQTQQSEQQQQSQCQRLFGPSTSRVAVRPVVAVVRCSL